MTSTNFYERFNSSWGQQYLIVEGPNLLFNFLQDYLNTIESHITQDAVATRLLYQPLTDPAHIPNHILEHQLEKTCVNIENLTRGFMFVLTFSLAENELRKLCKRIERSREDVLPLKNIKSTDQSISLTEVYIRYIGGANLPDLDIWKPWQDLKKYQNLRNQVVHNVGSLNNKDALKSFVEQHLYLSVSTGQGPFGEDIILFHEGFTEQVAKTSRDVLMVFDDALNKQNVNFLIDEN